MIIATKPTKKHEILSLFSCDLVDFVAINRISNIDLQLTNDEGWNCFAKSFFKTDRIHSFDPPKADSMFTVRRWRIRRSSVYFFLKLASFQVKASNRMKHWWHYFTAEIAEYAEII